MSIVDPKDPTLYNNRELSWLAFNRRVLEEAEDAEVPLLERLKFLCIVASNLDEFFMVRVSGLKQQLSGQVLDRPADGLSPEQTLVNISAKAHEMVTAQYAQLNDTIFPGLRKLGLCIAKPNELTPEEAAHLNEFFKHQVFPVLTPLVVDSGHPFPRLGNRSLNLALQVTSLDRSWDEPVFAVVQVPSVLPRLVELPVQPGKRVYVLLEDVVAMHIGQLFAGRRVLSCHAFRITRNYDLMIDEDEAEDLLKTIQKELRKRERGAAVRLEVACDMPSEMVEGLRNSFRLEQNDIYAMSGPMHLPDLMQIYSLDGFAEYRDEPFVAAMAPAFADESVSIFDVIKKQDVLLHHPYESFQSVIDFIEEAADDPNVLAIKQTLYRTSADSPIVRALMRGAENGKQVTALVELKARFDESSNIRWAAQLEESGVHVVYGMVGLKTHAKLALVVRREPQGLVRYLHLGTGNYNPRTANLYTDLSLFTARPEFGEDASAVFNMLTGYCEPPAFHRLIVAPMYLRRWTLQKIEAEARAGKNGRIFGQMNALVDSKVIEALYRASQAGVHITLVVRGICCLRPGIAGISENIRVFSVIDRFLEHRRMFNFYAEGRDEVYLGSADWMERNLNRRVEVLFPVEDPVLKTRILSEIIPICTGDTVKIREVNQDTTHKKMAFDASVPSSRSQKRFMEVARGAKPMKPIEALPEPRVSPTLTANTVKVG